MSDLRGGHSGFPFGRIRTTFRYADASLPFVTGWQRVARSELEDVERVAGCRWTRVLRKSGGVFLFIDDARQQGCLVVPGG